MPNIATLSAADFPDAAALLAGGNARSTVTRWVSPLELAFSQNVISPCFADGASVDEVVGQISSSASSQSGYDVELLPPFPRITTVWWRLKIRDGEGKPLRAAIDEGGAELLSPESLTTLDNRRLYALQRAAVAQHPKRCCVAVEEQTDRGELMRNAAVLKKLRSRTAGSAVTISEWSGVGRNNAKSFQAMRLWDATAALDLAAQVEGAGAEVSAAGDCGGWEYLDPKLQRRGPFSDRQMRIWWEQSMLPTKLRIRRYEARAGRDADAASFASVLEVFEGAAAPFEAGWSRSSCGVDLDAEARECEQCGRKRWQGWEARGSWYCAPCWKKWDPSPAPRPQPAEPAASSPRVRTIRPAAASAALQAPVKREPAAEEGVKTNTVADCDMVMYCKTCKWNSASAFQTCKSCSEPEAMCPKGHLLVEGHALVNRYNDVIDPSCKKCAKIFSRPFAGTTTATAGTGSLFAAATASSNGISGGPPSSGTIFGGAASSGGSLFGGAASSSGGLFEGATSSSGSLFGGAASSSGSLFGGAPSSNGSLFGGAASSGGSLSGGVACSGSTLFGGAPSSGGSLFGGAVSSNGRSFGGVANSGGSLFGGASSGGGLFGGSVFGGASSGGGIFGCAASSGSFIFGGTSSGGGGGLVGGAAGSAGSLFGGSTSSGPPGLFGGAASSGSSVFGGASFGGGVFGGAASSGSSRFGASSGGSLFGGAASSGGSLFGGPSSGLVGGAASSGGSLLGTEDEDALWAGTAKLYCFRQGKWVERGLGTARLMKSASTGRVRFLMCQEKTEKICCKFFVRDIVTTTRTGEVRLCNLEPQTGSDKAWSWTAQDTSDGEPAVEQLALKLKTSELAQAFLAKFNEAKQVNRDLRF